MAKTKTKSTTPTLHELRLRWARRQTKKLLNALPIAAVNDPVYAEQQALFRSRLDIVERLLLLAMSYADRQYVFQSPQHTSLLSPSEASEVIHANTEEAKVARIVYQNLTKLDATVPTPTFLRSLADWLSQTSASINHTSTEEDSEYKSGPVLVSLKLLESATELEIHRQQPDFHTAYRMITDCIVVRRSPDHYLKWFAPWEVCILHKTHTSVIMKGSRKKCNDTFRAIMAAATHCAITLFGDPDNRLLVKSASAQASSSVSFLRKLK